MTDICPECGAVAADKRISHFYMNTALRCASGHIWMRRMKLTEAKQDFTIPGDSMDLIFREDEKMKP